MTLVATAMDEGGSFETSLTLRTEGEWFAADLEVVTSAVDCCYLTILGLSRLAQPDVSVAQPEFEGRYLQRIERMQTEDLTRALLRDWSSSSEVINSTAHVFSPRDYREARAKLRDAFDYHAMFLKRYSLQVVDIRLGPEGRISFEGIGDSIGELRNLMREFWDRAGEFGRDQGKEIEFVRERLDALPLAAQVRTAGARDTAAMLVTRAFLELKLLERRGLLADVRRDVES